MTVPALTIQQPWASAILRRDDTKTVENRTWLTPLRGRIAVHAGVKLDSDAPGLAWGRAQPGDLDRGAVLGTVEVVDCHRQDDTRCVDAGCLANPWAQFAWTALGQKAIWHWILADPREFVTPIPARGALGLWHPGPSLEHLIAIAEVQA